MLRLRRPSAAMLVAVLALFVALGGPAGAARMITGKDVENGTLQARDLSRKARRQLTRTPPYSIAETMLGTNSVSTRALAFGSVLTGTVADQTLTAADLGPSSVSAEELADNAVGQAEIRNNGVGQAEIADNSVDTGEVIDGGLRVRDLARLSGTLRANFGLVAANGCETAVVDNFNVGGPDISGDLILVSSTDAGWPQDVSYGVSRAAPTPATSFRVYACNPTGTAVATPADARFRFAVLPFD